MVDRDDVVEALKHAQHCPESNDYERTFLARLLEAVDATIEDDNLAEMVVQQFTDSYVVRWIGDGQILHTYTQPYN